MPDGARFVLAPTVETDRFLSKDLIPDTVTAWPSAEKPQRIVILEVQQARKKKKLEQWPRYAAAPWLRHQCPVDVVVICKNQKIAEWYARPIPTSLRRYTHYPRILMPARREHG